MLHVLREKERVPETFPFSCLLSIRKIEIVSYLYMPMRVMPAWNPAATDPNRLTQDKSHWRDE